MYVYTHIHSCKYGSYFFFIFLNFVLSSVSSSPQPVSPLPSYSVTNIDSHVQSLLYFMDIQSSRSSKLTVVCNKGVISQFHNRQERRRGKNLRNFRRQNQHSINWILYIGIELKMTWFLPCGQNYQLGQQSQRAQGEDNQLCLGHIYFGAVCVDVCKQQGT